MCFNLITDKKLRLTIDNKYYLVKRVWINLT